MTPEKSRLARKAIARKGYPVMRARQMTKLYYIWDSRLTDSVDYDTTLCCNMRTRYARKANWYIERINHERVR